ncbi:hypothetical protein ACPV5O_26880 [Vibrio maritimus]|uniref:hypothetical protein n=1 Tax=Vibrio maritimus TaxID=990268 RepID=UPI004068E409
MNINEALEYARVNHQSLKDSGKKILGVAYTPNDSDAAFYTLEISLNEEDKEDGFDFYDVWLEGGHIPDRGFGVEDGLGNDDVNQLLKDLPPFALEIKYHVYDSVGSSYSGMQSAYALKAIFPQLPDPESFDLSDFKSKAVEIIKTVNT